jgi:hypothetical protein
MRDLLLSFILLSSSQAIALEWQSEMHHLKPIITDQESANECLADDIQPLKYISSEPKTEAWRSYYKIPRLLTSDLYKIEDVCNEAKIMNKAQGVNREYAIVANKNHFCDFGHRGCISTLKSLSDPCNNFIQDNFQVFHARTYIGSFRPSGSKEIAETYGQLGPSLLVIRLKDCQLIPTIKGEAEIKKGMSPQKAVAEDYFFTPPSLEGVKDSKGEYAFKSADESVRFKAMKDSLIKNIPELAKLDSKKMDCFENGKRTLPGIKDLEEIPYGKINVKGIAGIRKLMDEQLIEVTGKNPYTP